MDRPTIHETMMKCALIFADRSTCCRIKVGAVIALDNRIISCGYNGSANSKEHCLEYFKKIYANNKITEEELKTLIEVKLHPDISFEDWLKTEEFKRLHADYSAKNELHAEMNAIIYAAKKGISIEGSSIYITYSPCIACGKNIISSGIKKVYFNTLYDRENSIQYLNDNGIESIHLEF
jgi:dCMP deaminase